MAKERTNIKESTLNKYKLAVDEWFLNGFNGTEAYLSIYPKASRDTARNEFAKIIAIPSIKEYKNQKKQEQFKANAASLEELVSILSDVARHDIIDAFNEDGTLKKLSEMPKGTRMAIAGLELVEMSVDGESVSSKLKKIKISDRKGHIDMLMKHVGGYEKDNEQKKETLDFSRLTSEELKKYQELQFKMIS